MSKSTRNMPSSTPVAPPVPFAGLGHAMEAVEAVALTFRPRRAAAPAVARPVQRPVGAHGYALQCRLGRETRAG